MRGITLAVYRRYRPGATKLDLRSISDIEVQAIYRDGYWNPIKGDDLPIGVDLATFDFGVNSGVSRASKYLQRALRVEADGKIGNVTIAAARSASGKEVIQRLCGSRLSFVQALSTFGTFGKGWSRRIADVEAKAVAMCLTAGAAMTPAVKATLLDEAAAADVQSAQAKRTATGSAATGGTVGGADAVANGGPNWMLIAVLASVVIAALVVFMIRARQQKERSEAYQSVAAE